MGTGFFLMAIMGCADGSSACTPVATMPTRYESRSASAAATGSALASSTEFDFPTIVAECRAATAPTAVRAPAKRTVVSGAREG